MIEDNQYLSENFNLPEYDHQYGKQVHLIKDPYLFALLAKLGHPDTKQPAVNYLVSTLYHGLLNYAFSRELPCIDKAIETRMKPIHPEEGVFKAKILDPNIKAVTVNLARAGTLPSQNCFDVLNQFLNPDNVRQDHIAINRSIDASEKVVGTQLGGVKIGGDVKDSFVFFPDPMGATGSTIVRAMDIYTKEVEGPASSFIALHLILTPEYLRTVTEAYPDLKIYALRLDRGLSHKDILKTQLGSQWDQEKGLNEKQYIVPGAGGVGEVINNSYC